MRSFMERLLFPYLTYTRPPASLFGRQIRTAFIYTMNVPEEMIEQVSYDVLFGQNEGLLTRMFGHAETLCAFATLQFEDYGKMVFEYFDPAERIERRKTVFRRTAGRRSSWARAWFTHEQEQTHRDLR